MGKIVTFADLAYRAAGSGVKRAPITENDLKEMSAEVIRLASGASLTESVPSGSDRYLFTLTGSATVNGKGSSQTMPEEALATIPESTEFTVATPNGGRELCLEPNLTHDAT